MTCYQFNWNRQFLSRLQSPPLENTLQWRHNERDGVTNHRPHDCLLIRLFKRKSKKTSKLRVTGLCAGNSTVTGEFPAQKASEAEKVSIQWRHYELWAKVGPMNPKNCRLILVGMRNTTIPFRSMSIVLNYVVINRVHNFFWEAINHIYSKFDGGLAKPPIPADVSRASISNLIID